jgi:hypothetical protein
MGERKRISTSTETDLLLKSGRRCCICYLVNHDYSVKIGQIAHLDKNNANSHLENLAWLCLEHHNQYDSKTSQSKNFTKREVKEYRKLLYETVQKNRNENLNIKKHEVPNNSVKEDYATPILTDLEFIPYYSNDKIRASKKTNINFKFKNNTDRVIKCVSYQFDGYHEGKLIAQYPKHSFNLSLKPSEETIYPFHPIDPLICYFKNKRLKGIYESKITIDSILNEEIKTVTGIARLTIVS